MTEHENLLTLCNRKLLEDLRATRQIGGTAWEVGWLMGLEPTTTGITILKRRTGTK